MHHISTILRSAANERWPSDTALPVDPTQAWAGECGFFVDAVWSELESAGVDFSDDSMISTFRDLTCAVTPPPGLTLQEVSALGIERAINHHWLVSAGRHYDASCPEGVDGVFDLRVVRQAAVEVLQRDHPSVLERLCAAHDWWRHSVQLLNEFVHARSVAQAAAPSAAPQGIAAVNQQQADLLCRWLVASNGYREAKVLPDGSVAAVQDLLFTRAIALGCTLDGWCNRYCFDDRALADERFSQLVSEDDVPEGHVATRRGR